MTKPWSMAQSIAQPPMPKIITYMQKLRPKSRVATGLSCVEGISLSPGIEKADIGRRDEAEENVFCAVLILCKLCL